MKMNAHVLGIDPGANSGAALLAPNGRVLLAEQVRKGDAHKRANIVLRAVEAARVHSTDLVVMREKWQAGGRRANPKMLAGLGMAWGLWLEQLYMHAGGLPSSRYHQVYPSTWRKHVLGAHATSSDGWQRLTEQYVRNRWNIEPGPDAAVACCVGAFAFVNAKAIACVQAKPLWLRKNRYQAIAQPEADLAAALNRITELEAIIAEQAMATATLQEDIDQ